MSLQGPGQPSQRVFTGTVTKLHDNFGFVDEDVFFQTTVVKGQAPRVNVRLDTLNSKHFWLILLGFTVFSFVD